MLDALVAEPDPLEDPLLLDPEVVELAALELLELDAELARRRTEVPDDDPTAPKVLEP